MLRLLVATVLAFATIVYFVAIGVNHERKGAYGDATYLGKVRP